MSFFAFTRIRFVAFGLGALPRDGAKREQLLRQARELREQARVWTIFHGDVNAAKLGELLKKSSPR